MRGRLTVVLSCAAAVALVACGGDRSRWEADGRPPLPETRGSEHCEWTEARFLYVNASVFDAAGVPPDRLYDSYVRDPEGVLRSEWLSGTYQRDIERPDDAVATGYESDGRELYVSPAEGADAVFVQEDGEFERWPRFNTGCD